MKIKCALRLSKLGVPYPRTCENCGLGPCKDELYVADIYAEEKLYLQSMLNRLRLEYEKAAQPYFDRLTAIHSLQTNITVTMSEEQFKRTFLTDIKPSD
jgi:hypothetical protein